MKTMKKIEFALSVSMALFAPVLVGTASAQSAQWTATSSPVQATIAGGPWTLSQGETPRPAVRTTELSLIALLEIAAGVRNS